MSQWTRAKGFDTFCPVGPLVSDEVDPMAGVTIETRVNGEVRQQASTLDFIFPIPALLSFITAVFHAGAGRRDPDRYALRRGAAQRRETMWKCRIPGLGAL